jgi:hypothetical protein
MQRYQRDYIHLRWIGPESVKRRRGKGKDRARGCEEGSSAKCFPRCRVLLAIGCGARWIDGLHDTRRLSNREADGRKNGVVGHMKTEGKWSDIGVQGSKKGINRSGLSMDAGCLKVFGILGRREGDTPGCVGKHGGKCHPVWSSVSG